VVWILARGANAGLGNRAYTVLQTHLDGDTVRQIFNEGYMYPGDYPELGPAQSVNFGESAGWLAVSPSSDVMGFVGWLPNLRITVASATTPQHFVHLVLATASRNWPLFETPIALALMPHLMVLVGQGNHHGRLLLSTNMGQTWSAVVP
jgi:hypothetical protein